MAGLVFTLAAFGWGDLLRRWLFQGGHQYTGALNPALGISGTLVFSTMYVLLIRTSARPAWSLWLFVGVILCITGLFRSFKKIYIGRKNFEFALVDLIILALVGASLSIDGFVEITNIFGNCWDDYTGYWPQVHQILDRGTLESLFSFRRIASFGGQQLVQSFFTLISPIYFLNFFERVVCKVLLLVTVYLFLRDQKLKLLKSKSGFLAPLFILICLVDLDISSTNTASLYLPTILLVSYYILRLEYFERDSIGISYVEGFLLGSMMYFRANYLVGCAVIFGSELLAIYFSEERKKESLKFLKRAAVFGLVLVPGMILLWKSAATPFWPLINGNFSRAQKTFDFPIGYESLKTYWIAILIQKSFIVSMFIFFFSTLSAFSMRRKVIYIAPSTAYIFSVIAIGYATRGSLDVGSVFRYTFPFYVLALVVFFYQAIQITNSRWPSRAAAESSLLSISSWKRVAVLSLLGITLLVAGRDTYYMLKIKFSHIAVPARLMIDGKVSEDIPSIEEQYKKLSSVLPVGKTFLVGVEHPFLLDFTQNNYMPIDWPGMVSPRGLLNFSDSTEKVDAYLQQNDIDYFLFEDPNLCQCSYSAEMIRLSFGYTRKDPTLFTEWAEVYQRYFSYLESKKTLPSTMRSGPFYWFKIKEP
jgi:hypothetical protein